MAAIIIKVQVPMPFMFYSTQVFLTFLLQVLLVLTAISATWMFNRYLRAVQGQNRLAAVAIAMSGLWKRIFRASAWRSFD
jgi:hypothetical protein